MKDKYMALPLILVLLSHTRALLYAQRNDVYALLACFLTPHTPINLYFFNISPWVYFEKCGTSLGEEVDRNYI